jgi:ABC-type phosphate/phosphonate transport system substrate-binding protein
MKQLHLCAAAVIAIAAGPAVAADYYAGKTIEIIIGADVGGGGDFYGRLLAAHLGRHIPGKPAVIPKNMPGGGSNKAAAYIYSVAPKDGTSIGGVQSGTVMGPLTDSAIAALFDASKFHYLGTADAGARVCITYKASPTQSLADAQKRETVLAASGDGGSTKDYPTVLNAVAGTKFKVIPGYSGTGNMLIAMERGEVDGICGYNWSSFKSARPDWIRDKTAAIILQQGPEADPELTGLGVPEVWSYLKNDDDRKLMEFSVSEQFLGRPYVVAPETKPEVVAILRTAFDAMSTDPDYLADAAKQRLSVNSAPGAKIQTLVQKVY